MYVGDMLLLDFKPANYPSVNYVSLATSICPRSVVHRHTIQHSKLLDLDHFSKITITGCTPLLTHFQIVQTHNK